MRAGIPTESLPGETRVAVIPAAVPGLIKAGLEVVVEQGAGTASGFPDEAYRAAGATLGSRADAFAADIVLQVRATPIEAGRLRAGQAVIGFADPLGAPADIRDAAATGATLLSMELMPRITRAQSMDALSSMATIAGYKAVLLAANALPRMFPMLMTAAGTVSRRACSSSGAGVAGCRRSRRRGASAPRSKPTTCGPAVKEQVQSLGASSSSCRSRPGIRRGQGGLRQGAGRGVLPPPARDDAQGRRQQRRRRHDGAHPGQARRRRCSRRRWSRPWRRARWSWTSRPSAAATAS
jgi:H+-translocating NAD(P) transhydrogenase subunit alpha